MEVIKAMLGSLPLSFISVGIEYRFVCKVLTPKKSQPFTFFLLLAMYMISGQLNVQYSLVDTIKTNSLYYCSVTFFLYTILFKGSLVKKLFFSIFISYGLTLSFYIFLPFTNYFFDLGSKNYLEALQILEYVNILFSGLILEYVGTKFQNLKRELPVDYTFYLSLVILFVQRAVFSSYDMVFFRNYGVISLSSTILAAIFAIVGNAIVLIAIFAVDRQVDTSLKAQLSAIQLDNFNNRELERRKLDSFRHDIKNHLLCLSNLLENEKTEQAFCYMSNLTLAVKQLDSPVQTGNDYADALLGVKYSQALDSGIDMSLDMAIPPKGYLSPIDLCCILSNGFDNAITACKDIEEGKRWITARSFIKQGQLVIEIKNSKPSHISVVAGEVYPKKITAGHGIGLDTVKGVVKRYEGSLNLSAEQSFSFSVLIPKGHL